jgi:anti-sigma B factor antagonist
MWARSRTGGSIIAAVSDAPDLLVIVPTSAGLELRGELDAHTASELERQLTPLLDGSRDGDVSIDLAELGFIDSSGLRLLVESHQRADAAGCRLVLNRPSRAVVRLLEVSGLAEMLHLEPGAVPDEG